MKTSVVAKRGLAALLVSASAVAASSALAGADGGVRVVTANGALTDLSRATTDATDGASAQLVAVELAGRGTRALLIVTGMDADAVGSTFGDHVHTGKCVADQPGLAGPITAPANHRVRRPKCGSTSRCSPVASASGDVRSLHHPRGRGGLGGDPPASDRSQRRSRPSHRLSAGGVLTPPT